MQDEIEITLPVSGKAVVIRNYTTEADDEKSNEYLFAGVESKSELGKKISADTLSFPLANFFASQKAYIYRLVKSVDGVPATKQNLGELRSKDFQAIEEAVEKIVEEHSPKAIAAKKQLAADSN